MALARAVYHQADIYLLDDPLSVVDAPVARSIFEQCIRKFLAGKTVILVTHQTKFVTEADHVVAMTDGNANIEQVDLLKSSPNTNTSTSEVTKSSSTSSDMVQSSGHRQPSNKPSMVKVDLFRSIWRYLRFGARASTIFMAVAILVGSQSAVHYIDRWLARWTSISGDQDIGYIAGYCGLMAILFVTQFVRRVIFLMIGLNCSKSIHDEAFRAIVAAPMTFFERTSIGAVVQRISGDTATLDSKMSKEIVTFATVIFIV